MITFSFLIPYWNLDICMLQRMLDSIPHREDVEIIVLDNASDAVDKAVFPGLNDANTRVVFQEERTSVGHCRNRLIELARGEWIIFADADDRFITSELKCLMDMPEKETYDLIYWGLQQLLPNGTVIDDSLGFRGSDIQPLTDKRYALAHKYESPHKMVRRSLLMSHPEVRFDEILIYEDVSYSIQLLLSTENVGIYPPMVYQYIRRDSSTLGQSLKVEVLEDSHRHLFAVLDIIRQHQYPIHEQEVTKDCLIRLKHASKLHFCCALWQELKRYGWNLFYRDFVGASFETYETSLFRAFINYSRVKAGGALQNFRTNHFNLICR